METLEQLQTGSESRFWLKVKADSETGCWLWMAGKGRRNYGKFWFKGRTIPAHRHSYFLLNGPIPQGLFACHRCDNTQCVNPEHIFLGTPAANMADMVAKGRSRNGDRSNCARGTRIAISKLTDDDVRAMRRIRRETGASYHDIAARFGMGYSAVRAAITGETWAHVAEGLR